MSKNMKTEMLKSAIAALKNDDFNPNGKGYTKDLNSISAKRYPAPEKYPIATHPRVYFNSGMIDGIRAAMENPENKHAVELLMQYANEDTTGELGEKVKGSGYYHNYSGAMLDKAQAKAMMYVISGDEYYGYGAVLMIQNFLRTLDYDGRYSDQCREFGNIMYIAACVYDWCYPLLTDDDKFRIISGIEQFCLTGSVPNTSGIIAGSSWPVKMEIGFPPNKQGSAAGHGAENQLLRDYLSFAIAIYDDVPEWYEFIGGRFYSEYVDIRNQYYSAGLVPQGTGGYNGGRFTSDLFSACVMLAATGEIPYNAADMGRVVYGLVAPLTDIESKSVFSLGDFFTTERNRLAIEITPMIASYLFDDGILRGIAKWLNPDFKGFISGPSGMSPAEFLIYSSGGTKTEENPFAKFPQITYNGGWCGQMISRKAWSPDSPVSLMKIQEKTTANHDHMAAGSFQIYYKGMLTGDVGNYCGTAYGSEHCVYFQRATVSHNGLLIYNPALRAEKIEYNENERPINGFNYYYSGGQRQGLPEPSRTSWADPQYKTGTVKGYSYDSSENPAYSYLSGDVASAYYPNTVEYVGRSMLTVFPNDADVKMLLFVFDRIDAVSPDFKKTFLLQLPGEYAPIVDRENKTVTVTNGKGKLVLKSILGGDMIAELGGDDPTKEAPHNRLNYLLNGKQMHYYGRTYRKPEEIPEDGKAWGRIEISPRLGSKTDFLLNVMYVTDEGKAVSKCARGIKAFGMESGEPLFEGASFGNISAFFAISKAAVEERFTITLNSDSDAYICGLASGIWNVKDEANNITPVEVKPESGMIKIKAFGGKKLVFSR